MSSGPTRSKGKLTGGKWRPRLLDFVSALDESVVKSAFEKAFQSLPDISKAVSDLTVLEGMGQATASDNTTTPLLPESSHVGSETTAG
ncbi:hypothetical protein M0R45_036853 [Rubus argutus]|uniref:Uncharacterized protein n=1 Tax=Rubus argutus TaxID=59490 RepID=A0AAW1W150_RUBAR